MSELLSWLVSVIVVLLVTTFLVYLVSLRELSTRERPRTPKYDRLGRLVGWATNPDYHQNPGEDTDSQSG